MSATRKKTRKKSSHSIKINNNYIPELAALFSMLFIVIQRFVIISNTNIQGSAYFFSVFQFILVFSMILPLVLPSVIEDFVKESIEREQYKNARRVMYSGFMISVLYFVVMAIVVLFGFKAFQNIFLLGKSVFFITLSLLISVFFNTLAGVYLGFLAGIQKEEYSKINACLKNFVQIIFILIFANALIKYGEKVAGVLNNVEYRFIYGATGAAIGFVLGGIVSLITAIFMFKQNKKKIRKMMKLDSSRKTLDVYDLFRLISGKSFPAGLALLTLGIGLFADQWIYFSSMDGKERVLLSYQWGNYAGVFQSFMLFPILIILYICNENKYKVQRILLLENIIDIRKLNHELKKFSLIISISAMSLIMITAKCFMKGILGQESSYGLKIIYAGAPLLIFICYGLVNFFILAHSEKITSLIIDSLISFGVHLLFAIILVNNTNLGIFGIIIAAYIFVITFSVLSYLHLIKEFKCQEKFNKWIAPIVCSLIMAVVSLLVNLLFGLFMPAWLNFIFVNIIGIVVLLIALLKSNCVESYELTDIPLGNLVYRFCCLIRIL